MANPKNFHAILVVDGEEPECFATDYFQTTLQESRHADEWYEGTLVFETRRLADDYLDEWEGNANVSIVEVELIVKPPKTEE